MLVVEMLPDDTQEVRLRNAMNEVKRQAYIKDCYNGVQCRNRAVEEAGFDFRRCLPSVRFHRTIGAWANRPIDPAGNPIRESQWQARRDGWLPSGADKASVKNLMRPVTAPGKVAGWVAPPEGAVNRLPADYEYVGLA